MNIWNEKGAFYHNDTPLQQVGGGGCVLLESGCLSIRLQTEWFPDFQCQPFHLESPYHAYGLPMGQRCFLLNLGSKGQRSSTLDIKVAILCLGSRALSILPRVTVSYIWTTHGTYIFPFEFGVKRSKVKCTGHQSSNMVSGFQSIILSTQSHYIIHIYYS